MIFFFLIELTFQAYRKCLLEIKNFMGDLPTMVETQEKEVVSLKSEKDGKQDRITEIEKEMRHCEREIESMNTKMGKYTMKRLN